MNTEEDEELTLNDCKAVELDCVRTLLPQDFFPTLAPHLRISFLLTEKAKYERALRSIAEDAPNGYRAAHIARSALGEDSQSSSLQPLDRAGAIHALRRLRATTVAHLALLSPDEVDQLRRIESALALLRDKRPGGG